MPVQVGAGVAQVGIDNDSPYDAWVSFAPQQPALAPDPSTLALYNAQARSMATTYIPIPTDMSSPFSGVLWIGIYNPEGLASSGVISSRANLYVTALRAGEEPGQVFAAPRITDQRNQPRGIALPMGVTHWLSGTMVLAGSVDISTAVYPLSPAQIAARTAVFYLYAASVCPQADITGWMPISLRIQFTSAGTPVGAAFDLAYGAISANATSTVTTNWVYTPSWPHAAIFNGSVPASADAAKLQLVKKAGPAAMTVAYTIAFNRDETNLVPIADIGTAALYDASQASF